MGIGKFFSPDSQSKKPLEASQIMEGATSPRSLLARKNNVVSIVEHKFKRMNETHDRIRNALLASHSQNSR
jgi:hypothetical protein